MSQAISVQEASIMLPELIKKAADGETVVIGNEGQPEVTLQARPKKVIHERKIGFLDGKDHYIASDLLTGFCYK